MEVYSISVSTFSGVQCRTSSVVNGIIPLSLKEHWPADWTILIVYRSNRHLWLTLYWTTNLCNTYCYLAAHRAIQFHGQSWISIAENERISWHVTMQNSAGYLNSKWFFHQVADSAALLQILTLIEVKLKTFKGPLYLFEHLKMP